MRKAFLVWGVIFTAAALVCLAVGCGKEARDDARDLVDAASAAVEAGSAHLQLNAELTPLEGEGGLAVSVQGDAWLGLEPTLVEARLTALGLEISARYVEQALYIQMGGTWYRVPPGTLEGFDQGTVQALVEVVRALPDILSASREVVPLGEKKVGERACRRLGVELDLAAAASLEPVRRLAEAMQVPVGEAVAYLDGADLELEVCLEEKKPVIREIFLALDVDLTSLPDIAGLPLLPERARLKVFLQFPEYGMEVEVQPPSESVPFTGF